MDISAIKQQFKIIGNDPYLNRAIEIAVQVAATDLTVFINGESGTGKDVIPQIIHKNSSRKHGAYFAINCGAIPEGTIDSELFGHEKELLPVLSKHVKVISKSLMAVPCFSTKLENCPSPHKHACSEYWKMANLSK